MNFFLIKSVPLTHWSSNKPLNPAPRPLTVFFLCIGLTLFGLGESLIIAASLGMSPWVVLSEGLSINTGLSIGMITFLTSVIILLLWIPLKQRVGIGTLLNAVIIASVLDWSLSYLPHPETYLAKVVQTVFGTLIVGFGSALYLIANLGPGPRDGLMTGIQEATGRPIALVRVLLEVTVISIGWFFGGTIGIGTVIFAFGVGPSLSLGLHCVSSISKR